MVNAPLVTIPAAIISVFITIICIMIASLLLGNFKSKATQNQRQQSKHKKSQKYFEITAQTAVICNVGCCISISMYCIWIIFEAQQQLEWFILLRALPTIFWFVGKASLIWLYNGRLYYTFQKGIFKSSYIAFIVTNILITTAVPVFMTIGYLGVWYGNFILISLGFEGYRVLYILLTFYLLIMFSNKMLRIQTNRYSKAASCTDKSVTITNGSTTKEVTEMINHSNSGTQNVSRDSVHAETDEAQEKILCFLNVTTKNAVLVLFISISACLVTFWWTVFDYILEQSYLTLLVPLNMFAIDCVIDSCCIYLLFQVGSNVYELICGKCHSCCEQCLFSMCR